MYCKKIIFVFTALFFAATISFSQNLLQPENQLQKDSIDRVIRDIKGNINTYLKLEKISKADRYKYAYYKGNELKIISVMQTENNIEKKVSWYYNNDQYIYCEQHWIYTDSKKVISDQKFYLKKGHLIYWLNSENKPVYNGSAEFKELDKDLGEVGLKMKNTL